MALRPFEQVNLTNFQRSPQGEPHRRFNGPVPSASPSAGGDAMVVTGTNPGTAANTAVTAATAQSADGPFDLSSTNAATEKYCVFRLTVQGHQMQIDFSAEGGLASLAAVTATELAGILNAHPVFSKYAVASVSTLKLVITSRMMSTAASFQIADYGANDRFGFATTAVAGTGAGLITFTISCKNANGAPADGTPLRVYAYDAASGTTLEANALLAVTKGSCLQGYATNSLVVVPANGELVLVWADNGTGAEAIHLEFDSFPDAGGALNKPTTRITSSFT